MACALQAPLHAHSNGNTTDGDDDNEQSEQSKLLHDRLARFLASPGSAEEDAARPDNATRLGIPSVAARGSEATGDSHEGIAQDDDMCGPWMCACAMARATAASEETQLAPPAHWTPRSHAFKHTHHFLREQALLLTLSNRTSCSACDSASWLKTLAPDWPAHVLDPPHRPHQTVLLAQTTP